MIATIFMWTKIDHFYQRWIPPIMVIAGLGWLSYTFLRNPSRPPVGTYIAILAVLAVVVTLWPPDNRWTQASWIVVFFGVALLEILNLYKDRAAHDQEQQEITKTNRERFEATMRHIEGILETNTEMLIKEDKNLLQTMGGAGYPLFLPTYPPIQSSDKMMFPVKVIHHPTDRIPLIDVNVDVAIRPSTDSSNLQEVAASLFHSQHYVLGTILPGIFESPIQLQAGKRYDLTVTTRRGSFYEKLNIDADTKKPGTWNMLWCMYRYRDGKLLGRSDGKSLNEPCD